MKADSCPATGIDRASCPHCRSRAAKAPKTPAQTQPPHLEPSSPLPCGCSCQAVIPPDDFAASMGFTRLETPAPTEVIGSYVSRDPGCFARLIEKAEADRARQLAEEWANHPENPKRVKGGVA